MGDDTTKKSSIFYTRLIGEVDYQAVKDVIKDIDEANNKEEVKKIVFTICSWGGWLYPAFALYDHIKASQKPVEIIAAGYCASAAMMILQAGSRRIARPHTSFMVHPSNYSLDERKSHQEFLAMVEEYKRNHDLFLNLTIEKTKVNRKKLESIYEPRKYLTPKEAKEFGFVDQIEK